MGNKSLAAIVPPVDVAKVRARFLQERLVDFSDTVFGDACPSNVVLPAGRDILVDAEQLGRAVVERTGCPVAVGAIVISYCHPYTFASTNVVLLGHPVVQTLEWSCVLGSFRIHRDGNSTDAPLHREATIYPGTFVNGNWCDIVFRMPSVRVIVNAPVLIRRAAVPVLIPQAEATNEYLPGWAWATQRIAFDFNSLTDSVRTQLDDLHSYLNQIVSPLCDALNVQKTPHPNGPFVVHRQWRACDAVESPLPMLFQVTRACGVANNGEMAKNRPSYVAWETTPDTGCMMSIDWKIGFVISRSSLPMHNLTCTSSVGPVCCADTDAGRCIK